MEMPEGVKDIRYQHDAVIQGYQMSIYPFIQLCEKLLSDYPLFFLVNSYTTGLQPAVLTYMLSTAVKANHGGHVIADEVGLPVSGNGLVLPCGASGRWEH